MDKRQLKEKIRKIYDLLDEIEDGLKSERVEEIEKPERVEEEDDEE